jgi:HPr kinase/phosphorylase
MPEAAAAPLALHAGCVLVGEAGILLRGPPGCGKSTLARRLVAEAERHGRFAAHVADDRVLVEARHGRLLARPHSAIAGLQEVRGLGVRRVVAEPAARLRLVVDLGAEAERLPEPASQRADILGVTLPRLTARDAEAALERIGLMLAACGTG